MDVHLVTNFSIFLHLPPPQLLPSALFGAANESSNRTQQPFRRVSPYFYVSTPAAGLYNPIPVVRTLSRPPFEQNMTGVPQDVLRKKNVASSPTKAIALFSSLQNRTPSDWCVECRSPPNVLRKRDISVSASKILSQPLKMGGDGELCRGRRPPRGGRGSGRRK